MEASKNKPTEQEQTFIWFIFANELVQTKAEGVFYQIWRTSVKNGVFCKDTNKYKIGLYA